MTNKNCGTGFMHPALPRITPQRSIVKPLFCHVCMAKQGQYAIANTPFATAKDGLRHHERRPFAMQKPSFASVTTAGRTPYNGNSLTHKPLRKMPKTADVSAKSLLNARRRPSQAVNRARYAKPGGRFAYSVYVPSHVHF